MILKAKSTAPQPDYSAFGLPILGRIFDFDLTLFSAPEGYLLTDSLAALLAANQHPLCWVRLGLEDCDPGTLLLSLINGGQSITSTLGGATFNHMRAHPGPIVGWGLHFQILAKEFSEMLPAGSVLVLENIENLNYSPVALNSLGNNFLPALGNHIRCILISHGRIPRAALPPSTHLIDSSDLRLDAKTGIRMIRHAESDLTPACITRFIGLAAGRVEALASLVKAVHFLGPTLVDQEVHRAVHMNDCFSRIARDNLAGASDDTLQMLALALQLEYHHPAMLATVQPGGPWFQPLGGGWEYMRPLWIHPLRKALRARAIPQADTVHQAAEFLSGQRAFFQTVDLYFESQDTASAARSIAALADTMMDLGQWATLNAWLKRLPPSDLNEWPWLVYMGGKIAAVQGHTEPARKAFASAGVLFNRRQETTGTCLSLLAESSLAAWRGELIFAKERALSAYTLAQRKNHDEYMSWAAWQLGSLAANAGDLDEAIQWFGAVIGQANQAGNSPLSEMFRLAENLIQRRLYLQRQQKIKQDELLATERVINDISARLQNLITSPPENLDMLLETHGWTHIPLMPISSAIIQPMPGENGKSLATNFMNLLSSLLNLSQAGDHPLDLEIPPANPWPANLPEADPTNTPVFHPLPNTDLPSDASSMVPSNSEPPVQDENRVVEPVPIQKPHDPTPTENSVGDAKALSHHPEGKKSSSRNDSPGPLESGYSLRVRLLSQFSVELNGQPVGEWSNNRARAIFKYLLIHHDRFTRREVLMETFWPGSNPDSSRNSLNVAIHNLRVVLRSTPAHPVILFQNGAYCLDPDLSIWLDLDEYKRHVEQGHQCEASGDTTAALKEFEAAIDLYKGDLLSDDPYEEWPVLIRERLRVTHLETLDKMGQIYFDRDEYNACIALCQLILSSDTCREDAHCRLMRCYSRLGQDHLALRQYQVCVDALESELDVKPGLAITSLYEKIRKHEII